MKAATSRTATSPHFHFIGGKGGVGKTTCAAAFAVAASAAGERVLVATTDPAPSLGDTFKTALTGSPTLIRPRLYGVEIDAAAVIRRWISARRRLLESIALQGTWLDREDVARLLNLSLPGIDEIASLLEISRFGRSHRYDLIVIDTAPTGHTLRMLDMPGTLADVAHVFDVMRNKHRAMVEALRGGWTPEREDLLIQDLAREAEHLRALMTDQKRTRVTWVTLPEPMAIAETNDALSALGSRGIHVRDIVVNRLTPAGPGCRHCNPRRAFEAAAIRDLGPGERILVTAQNSEPTGPRALATLARQLQSPAPGLKPRPTKEATRFVVPPFRAGITGMRVRIGDLITANTRLLMFGGKGGVGKTTCAAAAAIAAATHSRRLPVLLISTDPAHSLADALGAKVTDTAARVPGAPANLSVREMDAARVFEGLRAQYASAIDGMFERLRGGSAFDLAHDRAVMRNLIDLAPPGLDELAAIVEITRGVSDKPGSLTVVDTAPTGHALRLLEMPALIHDWTKALMGILLKYQPVFGLADLGTLLLDLSKGIGVLRALLADAQRTHVVVVTRAAALPRAETRRLLGTLDDLDIAVPLVLLNAIGRGNCARCKAAAAAERREIAALAKAIRSRRGRTALALAPTHVPPPQSPAALREWHLDGWRYHQNA